MTKPTAAPRSAGVLLLVLAGVSSIATSQLIEPGAQGTADGARLKLSADTPKQIHTVRLRAAPGERHPLKLGEKWRLVLNADLIPPGDWTLCDSGGDCPDGGLGVIPEPPRVLVQITPTFLDDNRPFVFNERVEAPTHVTLQVVQDPDPATATASFAVRFERGDRAMFGEVAVDWRLDGLAATEDGKAASMLVEINP